MAPKAQPGVIFECRDTGTTNLSIVRKGNQDKMRSEKKILRIRKSWGIAHMLPIKACVVAAILGGKR